MARPPDIYTWTAKDLGKVSRGVAKPATGEWSIAELIDLSGISDNRLRQFQVRGEWDPADVATLVPFLARRGTIELRQRLVRLTFTKPTRKTSPPKSLAGLVEWLTLHGSTAYRRRILLGALGTERKPRARRKGGRKP
jgi:hypothetical protein